jgi:hypothetical protein
VAAAQSVDLYNIADGLSQVHHKKVFECPVVFNTRLVTAGDNEYKLISYSLYTKMNEQIF